MHTDDELDGREAVVWSIYNSSNAPTPWPSPTSVQRCQLGGRASKRQKNTYRRSEAPALGSHDITPCWGRAGSGYSTDHLSHSAFQKPLCIRPHSTPLNMGSAFSSNAPQTANNPHPDQGMATLSIQEPKRSPYHGVPVPAEASIRREDSEDWYAYFFGVASCAPQRDGKNVIICWPAMPRGHMHDPRELEGWPVVKIRKVSQRLGGDHPRIVWYADSHHIAYRIHSTYKAKLRRRS
jgi:hypothetical protein